MNDQPVPIEYQGQTYQLHPFTDELRGKFERWCETYALDQLAKRRSMIPDYADQRRLLLRDIITGAYKTGTPAASALSDTLEGQVAMLVIALSDERADEVVAMGMIKEIPEKVVEAYKLANGDAPVSDDVPNR